MKKIIITIDGHSACGKSTLARQLAEKLHYGYIDTGAMYRAVTYYFLENRVNVQKTREVDIALNKIDIHFKNTVGGNRTFLNGVDVEDAIRKMFVSKSVSHVAAMSKVRKKVVKQQQEMGKLKGIVMEGRDIGTVVFPKAELKMFLTASEEIRTQRRFNEIKAKGQKVSANSIKKNLNERDHLDSTRKDSPLKQAKEAILIDNTNLTQREQLAMVFALANERIAAINKAAKPPLKKVVDKKRPAPNRANEKSSNNQSTNRTQQNTKPIAQKARPNQATKKPVQQRTKPTPQKAKPNQAIKKPVQQRTKPTPQKARPNQATKKPVQQRTKPTLQKTKLNKPVEQKPAQKKQVAKKTTTKPLVKKAKPQRNNKKPNNRPMSPRSKPNTKKKDSIEDLLDDFSF